MMAYEQKLVARFAHDGYPLLEGETVISVWTFIKPIDWKINLLF